MNSKQGKTSFLYIYNSVEEEWDFISSFTKKDQKKLIHASNRFADCYLFANALLPSFTLISPNTIGDEFKKYFEELSGSRCTVLTPQPLSPFMCNNVINDAHVFSTLVAEGKRTGSLTIYTYVMTKQVFDLKRAFEKAGVLVFLPEAPLEKDVWTVGHFGSKSGFRKTFSHLMPKGIVLDDHKLVEKEAVRLFASSAGVVLKTDKGNAGQGIHIFRNDNSKSKRQLLKQLQTLIQKESFLKKHLLIIEEYIDTSKESACPFPSVECFIHQNGKIEIPYYCNMIVTPEGEFYGMEMHKSVLTKKVKKSVLDIAMKIAQTYKEKGFRGRFDIDMINDGIHVFANESNTRTNGGTDTYLMTKKLIGPDFFSKRYVISSYIDLPKKSDKRFSLVKDLCSEILYDKKKATGIIINSESVIINGGLSYIIIGKHKEEAISLHERLKQLLTNYKKRE